MNRAIIATKKIPKNLLQLIRNADGQKIKNLLIGIAGVYLFYFLNGYIHQRMTKVQYYNVFTQQNEGFKYAMGFVVYPSIMAWIVGAIINSRNPEVHQLPNWKVAKAASMTVISQIVVNIAIYLIDYPTSIMFKSCTIIAVLIVAIFCSKIKTKKLKLGRKKFITGGLITIGIIMYSLFRQADKKVNKQKYQVQKFTLQYFIGIFLLIISLVADGFLPDFQAELKQQYNPRPLQMYEQMNKWQVILCIIVSMLNRGQFYFMSKFLIDHPQAGFQMLMKSITGAIGQMFIYKLIKDFKQHVVPFVVTTRKLFSVVLSIILFNHSSTLGQVLALIIVFITVIMEFLIEVGADQNSPQAIKNPKGRQQLEQVIPQSQIQVTTQEFTEETPKNSSQ